MLAVLLKGPGGLDQVERAEISAPQAGSGQVLVRVRCAGLNHLDLWLTQGMPKPPGYPHVLGSDACGFPEGESKRVLINPALSCGQCPDCQRGEGSLCRDFKILGEQVPGTLAEVIAVPRENLEPAPEHLSDEEAGVLGLTFLTAWRMLKTRAGAQSGESLLITGIGGGVATSALVLAKALGLKVLVTSRKDQKTQKALALGADEAWSGEGDFSKWVREKTGKRGVDIALDSSGSATYEPSLKSLARGGRYVTCGATSGAGPAAQISRIFWNQLSVLGSTMGSREEFRDMLAFVREKKLKPVLDGAFPMSQARSALERLEKGEQFGKIALSSA